MDKPRQLLINTNFTDNNDISLYYNKFIYLLDRSINVYQFIIYNKMDILVTPITPYIICDHYISTEFCNKSPEYIHLGVNSNDLLKNKNYDDIKNYQIVQVQVDLFDFFYHQILPIIKKTA